MITSSKYFDNPLFQSVNFDNSLVDIHITHVIEHPIHYHDNLEIVMVLRGSIHVKCGWESFDISEGDFIAITAFETHSIKADDNDTIIAYIHFFRNREIDDDYVYYFEPNALKKNLYKYNEIKSSLMEIVKYWYDAKGCLHKINEHADKIVSILNSNFRMAGYFFGGEKNTYFDKKVSMERMHSIINYMAFHYDERISLESVANHFNIDKYYLTHFIKDGFGKSFIGLLNYIRVDRVEIDILTDNLSLMDVSYMAGFSSYQYFSKCFKEHFGMTPAEYRKKYKQDTLKYKKFNETPYCYDIRALLDGNSQDESEQTTLGLSVYLKNTKCKGTVIYRDGERTDVRDCNFENGTSCEVDFKHGEMIIILRSI